MDTQVAFAEQGCRPDMMLTLADGRHVACEHKIDAPDAGQVTVNPTTPGQVGRYLDLPDVDYVACFRSALATVTPEVLAHERYLRPASAPHFLWRDLDDPLCAGNQSLTDWLRDGFQRLGYTPPHPHYGELWPQTTQQAKDSAKNFGKLWHKTRGHLASSYRVTVDNRSGLYMRPLTPGPITLANVAPAGQGGSLLRLRVHTDAASLPEVCRRLEELALGLPAAPEVVAGRLPGGRSHVDLLAPLRQVLGLEADATVHEARLFDQVVPVLDTLVAARWRTP